VLPEKIHHNRQSCLEDNPVRINLRVQFPKFLLAAIAGMTVNIQVLNEDIGAQVMILYRARHLKADGRVLCCMCAADR